MASVYILYSVTANKYYCGSTKDLDVRISYHSIKEFPLSFTARYEDWQLYFSINDLSISTARKIEAYIKKMKSRKYIENLKRFPEITEKLIKKHG